MTTRHPRPSARRTFALSGLAALLVACVVRLAVGTPPATPEPAPEPTPTTVPAAAAEAAAPAGRVVLAHADGRTYWVAGVEAGTPARPGGLATMGQATPAGGPRTVVRSRELNRDGAWRAVAEIPGRAVDLADFRGDLAVLLDGGDWLTVFPGGTGRFVGPPAPAKLVALAAGEAGALWGIAEGGVRPMTAAGREDFERRESATTTELVGSDVRVELVEPDRSPDPATRPATAPAAPPRYELWSFAAGKWGKVADVPGATPPAASPAGGARRPAVSLAYTGGGLYAAFAADATGSAGAADPSGPTSAEVEASDFGSAVAGVRVVQWASDGWRDAGRVTGLAAVEGAAGDGPNGSPGAGAGVGPIVAFRLLAGADRPALWVADAAGRQTLFRAEPVAGDNTESPAAPPTTGPAVGATFPGTAHPLPFAETPPDPRSAGVAIAAGTLRVVWATGPAAGATGASAAGGVVEQAFARDGSAAVGGPIALKAPDAPAGPGRSWQSWALLALLAGVTAAAFRRQVPTAGEGGAATPAGAAEALEKLDVPLAPLPLRLAAGLVDLAPVFAAIAYVAYRQPGAVSASVTAAATGDPGLLTTGNVLVLWASLLVYVLHTAVGELAAGRSAGKLLFRLRVARVDGGPAGANAIVGRNLLRLLDASLAFVPLVAIPLSPLRQRLGDVVAGTVVVMNVAPKPVGLTADAAAEATAGAALAGDDGESPGKG